MFLLVHKILIYIYLTYYINITLDIIIIYDSLSIAHQMVRRYEQIIDIRVGMSKKMPHVYSQENGTQKDKQTINWTKREQANHQQLY
jgi:hypothetical protein